MIAEVSNAISAALDDLPDVENSPFVLEVTSPGVDRPLTEPRHWRRAVDRLVAIDLTDGAFVSGRITSSDGACVTVEVSGQSQDVAYTDIAKAVVQVEFDRKKDA